MLAAAPAVKLLLRGGEDGPDALVSRARSAVGELIEITHSSSLDTLLEMSALGVSKGSGLAALCAARGIDATEVIAFGDMPNDLPMLTWAGRGVAMAMPTPRCSRRGRDHRHQRVQRRRGGARGAADMTDRREDELRAAILELLQRRDPGKTICPSDAARAVAGDRFRPLMQTTRKAAARLVDEGRIEVTQRGEPVDPRAARGPIRLRLRDSAQRN